MRITGVKLSILESSIEDRIFGLHNVPGMTRMRWTHNVARTRPGYVEVLHVQTDEGIEGVCTAQGGRRGRRGLTAEGRSRAAA